MTVNLLIHRRRRLRSTVVFDTYWRFAVERQRVYFNRIAGRPGPWTSDRILSRYRFTNAYRCADRVSQYLIRRVIYAADSSFSAEDLVFRILLFKLFNRIETWELLEASAGPLRLATYDFDKYNRILCAAMAARRPIYSAAYIMPTPGSFGYDRKHTNHLALLESMMRDCLPARLARARRMQEGYELLRSYPSIGEFLAYQFLIDINYSELTDFSENDFVVPGPGAVEGIRKAFSDTGGLSDADVVRLTADRQHREFERRGLNFASLFGRPLHLIDCQNLYCEVAKYSRIAHPERTGPSGRTRIKQRFTDPRPLPSPWFPPKWGINQRSSTDSALRPSLWT